MEINLSAQKRYGELIEEIKSFIEGRKEPSEYINGNIKDRNPLQGSITVEIQNDFNFYKGALVLVDNEQGSVVDIYGSKVIIEFKEGISKFKDNEVIIDTSLMNIVLDRLEKTIKKIEEGNIDENNKRILDTLMGSVKPQYSNEIINFISDTLNSSQSEAVYRAINAEDFHLIIGPPGTGKTYVINEIIKQLVRKEEKILVTAWTNIAVDNIIERIPELGDKILRIGSKREISTPNLKYSLQEKRENHEGWKEVKNLDKLIKNAYEDIKSLRKNIKRVQEVITVITNKRNEFDKTLNNLLEVKEAYSKKAEKYGLDLDNKTKKYYKLKKKKENLERDFERYYSVSKDILELERINSALPDPELFYALESEIKSMHRRQIIKRILSIFNRKAYLQFLNELNDKETVYNKMKDSYNNYWDMHDLIQERYDEIYLEEEGHPDLDALNLEIELFKQLDMFIFYKNANREYELENSKKNIIFEAYKQYLSSLDRKIDILRAEIKDINTLIHIKINKTKKLNEKINNIKDSISKYKDDKKRLIEYIDSNIIKEVDIIAATVIGSANYVLGNVQFDYMIMDEASQVASFMSLLPLLKCKRFVLVGDDKQLQPIEESEISPELNLSIFNRLIEKYPEASTFLDTQYRMNQKISDIASKLFYGGKLKTFDAVAHQCLECELNSDLINPDFPLSFIDTANLKYYEEGIGGGCENAKEAQLVAQITEDFLKSGIDPNEIGIITPYKKHKANIKNHLGNNGIEVDTVYRFQGKEKDIIIMSFCNSKLGRLGKFTKGFIEQPTQVNVALTRAKKKFIMVGNSKTLKQSELLGEVIEMIEMRK